MSSMFPQQQSPVAGSSTQTATAADETTTTSVDLNEVQEVSDPTADYNISIPPPQAGKYPCQVSLHEDGISGRRSDKVGTFLVIPLELKVMAENTPYDGYTIRDWINNIYSKMKGTSAAHWLLTCLGETVPNKMSHQDLKTKLEQVLAANPVVNVDLDWNASYIDKMDKRANKDGYVTFLTSMKQFIPPNVESEHSPTKNPDGSLTYSHIAKNPVDGSPLYGRTYVKAYLKN